MPFRKNLNVSNNSPLLKLLTVHQASAIQLMYCVIIRVSYLMLYLIFPLKRMYCVVIRAGYLYLTIANT